MAVLVGPPVCGWGIVLEPIVLLVYRTSQPPALLSILLPVLPAAAASQRSHIIAIADDTLSASTRALSGGEMKKQEVQDGHAVWSHWAPMIMTVELTLLCVLFMLFEAC